MKNRVFGLLLVVMLVVVACGGGMPSARTARSVSWGYLKKYGRQYPSSSLGSHNIDNVAIHLVEGISYHRALVDARVALRDGHEIKAIMTLEKRFPGGWRVVSWEQAGYE